MTASCASGALAALRGVHALCPYLPVPAPLVAAELSAWLVVTLRAWPTCALQYDGTTPCCHGRRVAEQVQPQGAEAKHGGPGAGALPQEDGRTNSMSYHSMDADGLLMLAALCIRAGHAPEQLLTQAVPCDTKKKGRARWGEDLCKANRSLSVSLADVPSWAARYVGPRASSKWPFEQISSDDAPFYWAQVFRRAANLYRDAGYEAIVQSLPEAAGVSPRYVLDLIEPYTGPPAPTPMHHP